MTSSLAFIVTLLLCTVVSIFLFNRVNRRSATHANGGIQLIDNTLALIQLLQKHRGLGSQQTGAVIAQRAQIAREIDHHWRSCAGPTQELDYLRDQWNDLKNKPGDFDGHSLLIAHLLGFIEIQTSRFSEHRVAAARIAERCRALEDLARLRGLAMRAAQFQHCPIELRVPLKYLCENINAADADHRNTTLRVALREISEQLLDTHRTTITPARCFDMLTPIIDNALDEIRSSIHTLRLRPNATSQMKFASI